MLVITLALVICFTNFVKLTPCTEEGHPTEGSVYVAFDAVQTMRRITPKCTQLFFNGGGRAHVQESPDEIIKLQENRQDPQ